jgi:DNA-binding response OmpR family regulator
METIKVLFIDDDIVLGQLVATVLREEGFDVHFQNSLTGVKSVVSEFKPNIIILDVEIGMYDGIEAAPQLQQIQPETPILFVSSHCESQEVIRALKTGAVTYLKKPIEIEELVAYIKRYVIPLKTLNIKLGSIELNPSTRILSDGQKKIKKLSRLEFMLLKLLYDNKNQIVPREEIEKLWDSSIMSEHSLYNYIVKLRKLLSVDKNITITTMHENGYILHITDD